MRNPDVNQVNQANWNFQVILVYYFFFNEGKFVLKFQLLQKEIPMQLINLSIVFSFLSF